MLVVVAALVDAAGAVPADAAAAAAEELNDGFPVEEPATWLRPVTAKRRQ